MASIFSSPPPPHGRKTLRLTESQASAGQLIRRLLGLAWAYRMAAIVVLLMQLILLSMALAGLGLTGLGIDVLRHAIQPDADAPRWPLGLAPPQGWSAMANMGVIAGMVLTLAITRFWLDRTSTVFLAKLVQNIVIDLRQQVYDKLQRLSFRFFDSNESGSIINRVTGDVQAVRAFVDQVLIVLLMMFISLGFFLVYMFSIHVTLTLVCLATTPLLIYLTVIFANRVKPAYRKNRELFDRAVRVLAEDVQGHHVVKGFALQRAEIRKFRRANFAVKRQQRWIFRQNAIFVPLINSLPMVNIALLLVYGGWLFVQGEILLGSGLYVFAGLLTQFSTQIGNIANITNTIQRSLIGAARVFEVLDQPLEITSKPDAKPLKNAKGELRLENVSFSYVDNGDAVLDQVNLHVAPGETVAILGATGSGKSTLLSLIPRFYDPDGGRILLDGVDLRDYELDDLRRSVGIVFQESFLFSHTVAENISFGYPQASRELIEKAARIAQAHEFIMELPKGYDTRLSEGGNNLSGGQRQRLAIARAVLLEPPILLLDDPTAAIDPDTEHEILTAMDRAMEGRTTFVVAHRLSTLRRADKVIVLDKGQVVQRGTHDKLMDEAGHYSEAANLQMADDESLRLLGMDDGGAS